MLFSLREEENPDLDYSTDEPGDIRLRETGQEQKTNTVMLLLIRGI